jgi:hypothetical protein
VGQCAYLIAPTRTNSLLNVIVNKAVALDFAFQVGVPLPARASAFR